MADPASDLPSGVDPSDPGVPSDSALGADRVAAINAEKKKWRDTVDKKKRASLEPPTPATPDDMIELEQDFDE